MISVEDQRISGRITSNKTD